MMEELQQEIAILDNKSSIIKEFISRLEENLSDLKKSDEWIYKKLWNIIKECEETAEDIEEQIECYNEILIEDFYGEEE